MRFLCYIVFIFICLNSSASAQIVTVSEDITMLRDVDYDIMGKFGEYLLISKQYGAEVEIEAYDYRLYKSWTKKLNLDVKKAEVISIYPGNNYMYVYYIHERKDSSFLMVRKFDAAAELVDSALIKSYFEDGQNRRFKLVASENKEMISLHCILTEDRLEVLYFDNSSLKLLADHLYDVSTFDFRKDFSKILISDRGDLFMILDNAKNATRKTDQVLVIIRSGLLSDQPFVMEMKELDYFVYSLLFEVDNKQNAVIAAGLYNDKPGNVSMGFVTFKLPASQPDQTTVSYIPYEAQTIANAADGKRTKVESISDLEVMDIMLRHDGGLVVIAEERKEYERSLYQGRRDFYSMRFAIDFYYEDMVIAGIHPDGTSHWQKILQKKQYSFDDDAMYSSYFTFKNSTSVRILFNDEIKNENTVSEYILSGGGKHERKSVLNTNRQDLKLQVRSSMQISANEIIIPSVKRNKLKLVKVTYQRA